jgi:acyl carrier protein
MTSEESMEARVTRLALEYATTAHSARPLPPELTLRNDLSIESLSLVSLTLRLGDELGVDVVEAGVDLGPVVTLGDLVNFGHRLAKLKK